MKILFLILILSLSFTAEAFEPQKTRTTLKPLESGRILQMHWHWVYEGFDTVHKLEFIKQGKITKTIEISGQPVFNKDNTLVAFPDCWHGGCELILRILDLNSENELQPVRLKKEAFLKASWVEKRKLKVFLGGMAQGEKSEVKYIEFGVE